MALAKFEGHIPIGYLHDSFPSQNATRRFSGMARPLDDPRKERFRQRIKGALDKLNDVHEVPQEMPSVNVRIVSGTSTHGSFDPAVNIIKLNIDEMGSAAHNRTTVWHEVGHAIDDLGVGSSSWAVNNGSAILPNKKLFAAPHSRRALTKLRDVFWENPRVKDWKAAVDTGKFRKKTVDSTYMEYIARDEEIFARGYSQYVAAKTADVGALQALNSEGTKRMWGFGQWTDAGEFDDIFDAFDELFATMDLGVSD